MNANFAILKCCNANGIPIIVIHNSKPQIRCTMASSIPHTIIHITLPITPITPKPPGVMSRPKGQRTKPAILKHCTPNGMPMIVMQSKRPTMNHKSDRITPPNTIQSRLPIIFMIFVLSFLSEIIISFLVYLKT